MKHTSPATLNAMLQNRVKQHPEKLALIFKDNQWSYAGFQREVDRVANGFIRIGVKRGDRIAFVVPNCAEFLLAVFAVTKIGAVFVPLNPQYTAEEAEYVLQHSEASVVITSPELLPLIDPVRDKLANLSRVIVTGESGTATSSSWKDFLSGVADDDLNIAIDPEDLASITYTSGTTDRPKGVMLSQYAYAFAPHMRAQGLGWT